MEHLESSIQESKNSFSPWLICLTASLFPLFAFVQMNLLNVLHTDILKSLSIDETKLGSLSALYIYADAMLLIPAGLLLDRYSARKLLMLGMSVSLCGTILFASANTLSMASVARFISGSGHAFALISCFKLVADLFPSYRHAFVISLVITIAMLGGALAQTPLAILSEIFGWRISIGINAACGCVILYIIFLIFRRVPMAENTHTQPFHFLVFWQNIKYAFLNFQNWLCGLYICFLSLPLMLLGALWGSSYLISQHNLILIDASFVTSMIFFGTIAGSPTFGWIADHFGKRKVVMILGGLFSLITISIILHVAHLSYLALIVLFFLLGFFASAQVIGYPVVVSNNPKEYRGTSMGFTNVLIMAGAASIQLLFGKLLSAENNYTFAMSLLPIAFILSILIASLTRKGAQT